MRADRIQSCGDAGCNRPAVLRRMIAWAAVIVLCLGGCGGPAVVDSDKARETLNVALESWKKREEPKALRSATPEIVVQDPDWNAGRELVAFEVVDEGKRDNANLRCKVRLTLRDVDGRTVDKQVGYVVGTSPVLTVFRDLP